MLHPSRRMMISRRVVTWTKGMISTGADGCPRHNNNSFRMPAATLHNDDSNFPMSRASVLNCSNLHPIPCRNYYHPFSHITMLPSNDSSSPFRRQDQSSRRWVTTAAARRSMSSSSASRRTTTPSIDTKHKPWLDPQRILSARVEALVDSPWIHPAEFRVDSDLHELLLGCCRLQSIQGQQMAQEIMERLLLEKTRLNNQQKEEEEGESAAAAVVYIPERFWQNLIFGWSKLAGKLRVARLHMQENLQSAIEAAKEDYRRDQDSRTSAGQSTDDKADDEYELSSDRSSSSEPTVELFNTFLLGLARAAKILPGTAMQAESTLFDMMEYHERFGWHTKPNTRSYTHVINAHVNSRHKTSGGRALDILNHVKQMHETERQAYLDRVGIAYHERGPNHPRIVTPDGIMYTSVMMAMLNSMSSRKVVELLHEFLDWAKKNNSDGGDETIQVDASHFTVPIRALGNEIERSNNAALRVRLAKKAESILNLMFEYMAQRKQNVALSDNEDKQVGEEEEEDVRFGKALYAFNACLDAWGRAHAQEAALRCEDLLKKMLDKSINTTNDSASNENNNVTNSAEIDVVVEPDTVSFNACLQAWSKAHSFYPDAAYRANDLLDLFCRLHTSGLVKKGPDLQSWTITILALQHVTPSKSSGDNNSNDSSNTSSPPPPSSGASIVRRARRLLEEMLDSVQSQSTQISRNLSGPFTAVIRVAAKMAEVDFTLAADLAKESTVDGKDAAAAVDSLLFGENVDHEERNEEEEDEDPYSIACRTYREAVDDLYDLKDRQRTKNRNHSNNNDRDDDSSSSHSNLSMGDSIGSDTRSGIADHHTFAAMLTCIDKYNPHPTSSERKAFGDAVFADACQAGQVSRVVLHEATVVLQLPAAVEVVSTSRGGKNEIPRFWYRNVEGSWRPK